MMVLGDQIIETPNVIRSRAQETYSYRTLLIEYMQAGAKWISAPKPMLLDSLFEGVDMERPTPRNDEPAFDAANVLRFGEDLIYLVSATGNEMGGHWLRSVLGDRYRIHVLKDVYYGSHIDSTLVALRPGLILANPSRLNDETLPSILKQWKVIYSPPMENTDRYDADYLSMCIGSDWIDMNAFSIKPDLVVVDRNQPTLIKILEKEGLDVIPLKLRHSKLLGGGPHCVTLDVRRRGKLERYFD
jgi:N-dimethylarginine dimethylaminohydrolase